jgi:hypothetical protein
MNNEVFAYTSVCCGARAEKTPCVKAKAVKKAKGKGKQKREETAEYSTLGTWRCSACGKKCKCSRTKAEVESGA